MLYVLGGENTFESTKRLQGLLGVFQAKNSFAQVSMFDEENQDISGSSLGSLGMFSKKSIHVFKRFFQYSKNIQEQLASQLVGSSDEVLIWEDKKIDKRLKIYKDFCKIGKVEEFNDLKPSELAKWIRKQFSDKGLTYPGQLVDNLAFRYGPNQWIIQNEIEKLAHLASSTQRNQIIESDNQILSSYIHDEIWNFVNALFTKNRRKALKLIDELLATAGSEFQIIGAIVSQMRALYLVNSRLSLEMIQNLLHIHPFVLKKVREFGNYNLESLRSFYTKLANLESSLKEGAIDAKLGLTFLVLDL
jgi:DNA polymerase III delta subunit